MRDKPNSRRWTTFKQCKENVYCDRHKLIFSMNHIHLARSVFVIVTTTLLFLLPAIVKCDNNNVLNEIDNGGEVHAKNTLTELTGGRVIGEKWLRQMESPYSLETDLTVERSGKLFIEPGVTVHVAPMVGITVRGVLSALVSSMIHCVVFFYSIHKIKETDDITSIIPLSFVHKHIPYCNYRCIIPASDCVRRRLFLIHHIIFDLALFWFSHDKRKYNKRYAVRLLIYHN